MRLGVPVFLGSQLTNPSPSGEFREPSKHWIRDCKDIANMSDFMLLLWRENGEPDGDVIGKLEKSKAGGDGTRFRLIRDASGVLREVDERYEGGR